MTIEQQALEAGRAPHVGGTIKLMVHYPAAVEPFRDRHAHREETIGQLKARVLETFGLTDGATLDGNIVTYVLYHHKDRLDDPNRTLGSVAGEHHEVQLKLAQELTQG